MSKKVRSRKCPYCKKQFTPLPQCAHRQKCCGDETCKTQHKKNSQAKWVENNPHYFKNRYQTSTKPWLDAHPGYLQDYRATHPEYVEKNRQQQKKQRQKADALRVDIQDVSFVQELVSRKDTHKSAEVDIQDESFLQLSLMIGLISHLRRVDIQDELVFPLNRVYNRGRFLLQHYFPL